MNNKQTIKLTNIHKTYTLGQTKVKALTGINLTIDAGDFVAVAGPSGSGKTTIMNIIGLIDKPDTGSLVLGGNDVTYINEDLKAAIRNKKIGFIFQSFNLIPVLDIYENIELPLLVGTTLTGKNERKEWIEYLIEEVGLSKYRSHKPSELSGGQRQRVAIARSLAAQPDLVIADEPTANLDSETGMMILELMKK